MGGGDGGGGGSTTSAGSLDQTPEASGADGVGSVLDYGGDGSPVVAGAPAVDAPGVLEGADGLFMDSNAAKASGDVVGGPREVFDRPAQSSGSTPLSTGRPQIV